MTLAGEAPRRRAAASALSPAAWALGAGLSAAVVALGAAPEHWLDAERGLGPTAADPIPTLPIWQGLARALPVADLALRTDLLAALLVVLNALAAMGVAHALFRGPGRFAATATVGPVATLGLSRWALAVGSAAAVPDLVVTALATGALWSVVAARVAGGRVSPGAVARSLAGICAIAVVSLRAAIPLLLVALPLMAATARPPKVDRGERSASWRRLAAAAAMGTAPVLVALAVITNLRGPARVPDVATTVLSWPDPAVLVSPPFASVLYPAIALLLVMTLLLRWRGAPWLWGWALVPLVLVDQHGPWVPVGVTVTVLAVAAAGWVWLAGLIPQGRFARGTLASLLAAVGLSAIAWSADRSVPPRPPEAIAHARPVGSLVSVYARGMLAPGDVLIVHDPWLAEALADRRALEGFRPDLAIVAAATLTDEELSRLSLDFRATGRRIVSDSYNLGGRTQPDGAIDSGPLFWFVGDMLAGERDFTDLSALFPSGAGRSPARMRRWYRLAIERSRFRRAVQDPQAALSALPLDTRRYRSLVTRLQLARSAKADPSAGSELPAEIPSTADSDAPDEALVLAEAGDLLFSHGEQARASELLIAAANDGYAPAWGALARWQLRAGQTSAANATLSAIAGEASLRRQGLDVLLWLLWRDRVADARALVDVLGAPPPQQADANVAALELAARLRLLDAMAQPPANTSGTAR